jgi:nucleoside-diphosphate-sugar epimerase
MKKIFITGGSGFVGQNLIPLLISKGYSVNALARSPKTVDLIKQLGADPIEGDLDNVEALKKGIIGCESVFHIAASVDFYASENELYNLHVTATKNLLEEAKRANVKNFVYLSAASVIINGKPISNADENFISDNLIDGYSITKLMAEKLVLKSNSSNFRTIALRAPLIWGKGDMHVLPGIMDTIQKNRMQFIGGGKQRMATCHVKNVCEGLMLAEESSFGGEVYFIADEKPVVAKEFITDYVSTQGVVVPDKVVSLRMAKTVAAVMKFMWKVFRLKGNPPLNRAMVNMLGLEFTINDAKARRDLGYKSSVSIAQGLDEMKLQSN